MKIYHIGPKDFDTSQKLKTVKLQELTALSPEQPSESSMRRFSKNIADLHITTVFIYPFISLLIN